MYWLKTALIFFLENDSPDTVLISIFWMSHLFKLYVQNVPIHNINNLYSCFSIDRSTFFPTEKHRHSSSVVIKFHTNLSYMWSLNECANILMGVEIITTKQFKKKIYKHIYKKKYCTAHVVYPFHSWYRLLRINQGYLPFGSNDCCKAIKKQFQVRWYWKGDWHQYNTEWNNTELV